VSGDVVIQIAMEAEAKPCIDRLRCFGEPELLASPLPALVRAGVWRGATLRMVTHGVDARFGVDCIGTQPAAVTAWAACTRFRPRLIINAGTAGGFARERAEVGDVYITDGPIVFHDRRVPLGSFQACGIGSYPSLPSRALAAKVGLKLGRLTTGDSLDLSEADARQIAASGANVKDMEGAAIAWVASLLGVPFVGLKSITDLVDGEHPAAAQFVKNLQSATARLAEALDEVLPHLIGL
jgi:5'-methylthioadenosine nucleosidase